MARRTSFFMGLKPHRSPPKANGDTATVIEGASVVIDVLANDEGPTLGLVSVGTPTAGSAVLGTGPNAGKIVYTAPVGFVGVAMFAYTMENTVSGDRSAATVAVTVTPDEDTPDPTTELPAATSTVTVSGANANARFADLQAKVTAATAGQHIVIPNGVVGDGTQTLNLKGGVAYVIKAANPVNPATFNPNGSDSAFLKCRIFTGATMLAAVDFYGLNIDGTGWNKTNGKEGGGIVKLRGNGWRFRRCRIFGWKGNCILIGDKGAASGGGAGGRIAYNHISVKSWTDEPSFPLATAIPERSRMGIFQSVSVLGDVHTDLEVDHNYFTGFPPRGTTYDEWENSALRIGVTATHKNYDWRANIHDNVFEHIGLYTGAGTLALSPIFEIKGSQVRFRLNTFNSIGPSMNIGIRNGQENEVVSNFGRGLTQFRVFDAHHKILGNVFNGMTKGIEIMAGNVDHTVMTTGGFNACFNSVFSGNKVFGGGAMIVGNAFTGSNQVKVDDIVIDGMPVTQNPGESYNQARERLYGKITLTANIAAGGVSTSPYAATAANSWPAPVELFYPKDVGPTAGLTAPSLSVANYTGQWTAFLKAGSGSSITQVGTVLRITAGAPASATVRDATKDALLVSKAPALAGDGSLTFEIRSINTHAGAGVNPSALVTMFYSGNGSAGHPADPNSWTTEAGVNGYAFFGLGTRVTLDPTGDAGNEGEIRARYHNANGANAGPNIIDSSDYAGQAVPRRFKFTLNTWYRIKITRSGDNLTVQQWSLATGSPVEITPSVTGTHANISDLAGGYVILAAMQGRSFEIRNVAVA